MYVLYVYVLKGDRPQGSIEHRGSRWTGSFPILPDLQDDCQILRSLTVQIKTTDEQNDSRQRGRLQIYSNVSVSGVVDHDTHVTPTPLTPLGFELSTFPAPTPLITPGSRGPQRTLVDFTKFLCFVPRRPSGPYTRPVGSRSERRKLHDTPTLF